MEINDKLTVKIEGYNHQGCGIARVDDKVIFVAGALIDETALIEITKINKKFIEAKVINYVQESKDRCKVNCPYYKDCGGCDIAHMTIGCQLNFKREKVIDIMHKFAHIDNIVKEIIETNQFNYRNKATFHVNNGMIGFYQEKSYNVIDMNKCDLSSNIINNILEHIRKLHLKYVKNVVIRSSYKTHESMIILDIENKINELDVINNLKNIVSSIYIKENKKYKLIYGKEYIEDQIGEMKFIISPDSFFQVNTLGAYKLYSKVKEYVGGTGNEKLLDLYCGTGTIGIFLADDFKRVLGVEINESAVHDANINKDINNISNIEFICGDSGKVLKESNYKPDVIVVDPPRSGLDSLAINEITELSAKKIVYVSCDPITLARDLNILKELYDVKEITLVDMFPNTHHVECICVMELR